MDGQRERLQERLLTDENQVVQIGGHEVGVVDEGHEHLAGATRETTLVTSRQCEANCFEEPGAGEPHAGICEGGAGQPASLPR